MLNSRKQQSTAPPQKPRQMADAREKLSLKRSSPAAFMSPPVGTVTPALKLTKTIQVGVALVVNFRKPVTAMDSDREQGSGMFGQNDSSPRCLCCNHMRKARYYVVLYKRKGWGSREIK